ncbi:MAG: hypothetical protein PHQ86_07065 [Dehalococcoidales bacterium]|nr:hypothetical protein [Dehalococcoidales bacterium]
MCIFLGEIKWRRWIPNEEYLNKIKNINTIKILVDFMKDFEYTSDILTLFGREVPWDSWQMPDVSIKTMTGDCEDSGLLAIDILGRVIKRTDSMLMITAGYYKKDGETKRNAHAVVVIPNSKFDVISNNNYFTGFKTLKDISLKWYPEGIIYQKKFDWQGRRLA